MDVDQAFDPEYARRIGCIAEEIFIARPADGLMALKIVDTLVRSSAFDVVVLDSVVALYSPPPGHDQAIDGRGRHLVVRDS